MGVLDQFGVELIQAPDDDAAKQPSDSQSRQDPGHGAAVAFRGCVPDGLPGGEAVDPHDGQFPGFTFPASGFVPCINVIAVDLSSRLQASHTAAVESASAPTATITVSSGRIEYTLSVNRKTVPNPNIIKRSTMK